MSKYIVTLKEIVYYTVAVEASTEDDAVDQALQLGEVWQEQQYNLDTYAVQKACG
jgi:hypothetical protein